MVLASAQVLRDAGQRPPAALVQRQRRPRPPEAQPHPDRNHGLKVRKKNRFEKGLFLKRFKKQAPQGGPAERGQGEAGTLPQVPKMAQYLNTRLIPKFDYFVLVILITNN